MFVAIRKYHVRRGSAAEWAQRVETGFVPLMRELEGFQGYYLLNGGQDCTDHDQHVRQRGCGTGLQRQGG